MKHLSTLTKSVPVKASFLEDLVDDIRGILEDIIDLLKSPFDK